jgi:hypothetical protein
MVRGVLPDAVDKDRVILLKACSFLRLTNELRTAAFAAANSGRRLWLVVRSDTELHPNLVEFAGEHAIRIERSE